MIAARRPSHANIGTELLVIRGVVGMASAGAIVARRLRSKATGASQAPGTSEATGTATSLNGHEFSFSGHTFHILQSAREADDGTIVTTVVAILLVLFWLRRRNRPGRR